MATLDIAPAWVDARLRSLRRALRRSVPVSLVVSDVDDTLISRTEPEVEVLCELFAAIEVTPGLQFALNSSRPCASVRETLDALPCPVPHVALIGAMGTEIEVQGQRLVAWSDRFSEWDRAVIDEALADLGVPHADAFQTPLKASYAIPSGRWAEARARVRETGQPSRIVTSGVSDFDVMPEGADKGEAARFLMRFLDVPDGGAVAAGDSGNDLALFAALGGGVVVGNARAELRDGLAAAGLTRRVVYAKADCAAGVLEGLGQLGVLAPEAVRAA